MEDGLSFERQKRLHFVRATYIYICSYEYRKVSRRDSRCLSCKVRFWPGNDAFHFMNYCTVWGFLMLLEHCSISSQIKCCIRSDRKSVVYIHSKLSGVCDRALTRPSLHTPLWQFHTKKEEITFKHKLNLRTLQKLQCNHVKESLLSVHNYYLGKKAPEAISQIAGNFKHL